ncbi:hypothetical protein MYAM1_001300 [Malassezia yamatoensis]|uniref:Spc7 kinetochore protein domain-containing protein n=1 Tax=Malassezia yamatoensis TaxID=253288 RepID=A0AAJ5YSU0_9BASI|nr:hypothetical protein MYAM1_001300 [Malassezia yamatoensis]
MEARKRKSMPGGSSLNKENASPGKSRRKRALSIGVTNPTDVSPMRKIRAPRKSALRATPQVFRSPTGLGPSTERDHIRTQEWSDIAQMVEESTRSSLQRLLEHDRPTNSPGLPNPFAALYRSPSKSPEKSAVTESSVHRKEHTVAVPQRSVSPAALRTRRRVTFSAHQEQTDFEQDEPTMSIRPAQKLMERGSPVPSSIADTSVGSSGSEEISMDLTMDSSGSNESDEQSFDTSQNAMTMEMTNAWTPDLDQSDMSSTTMDLTNTSTATDASQDASEESQDDSFSMQLTQAYRPQQDHDITSSSVESTRQLTEAADESAMELTATWGKFASAARQSPNKSLSPKRSPVRRQTMVLPEEMVSPSLSVSREQTVVRSSPYQEPKNDQLQRTPPTQDQSFVSPAASTRTPIPTTPIHQRSPYSRRPTDSEPRSAPDPSFGSPTRFRQSLRGAIPSPNYQHSPARRLEPRTPPQSYSANFATVQRASPMRGNMARASISAIEGASSFQRSPFIHSMLKQRGRRTSPIRVMADESVSDESFHMQLAEFLQLIGLKFHEDMTASRSRAERPAARVPHGVSVVDAARLAGGAAPMLVTLRNACMELKQHVEDGRLRLQTMEADFYTRPPAFVQEWGQLEDEEMRRSMKGQLNVHKQAARAAAMHDYYGWRTDMEFDEELAQMLERHRDLLKQDAEQVAKDRTMLCDEKLPLIRAHHAELKKKIADSHARQAAIAACDADELRELLASIEEQNTILQTMRAHHSDIDEQLTRARMRLEDVAAQSSQTQAAIRTARAISDQIRGCSPGEAVRLQRHVRHLEQLWAWRITNHTSTLWQLVHYNALHVTLELDAKRKIVRRVAVSPVSSVDLSQLHLAALAVIRAEVKHKLAHGVPAVLRTIARHWAKYLAVRAEVARTNAIVPVTVNLAKGDTQLELSASVLLSNHNTKFSVGLRLDLTSDAPFVGESVYATAVYGQSVYTTPLVARLQSCLATSPNKLYDAFKQAMHSMVI